MTFTWIEKLFHRIRPQNRSMLPERDVEPAPPRSIQISPPKTGPAQSVRAYSMPIAPRRAPPAPEPSRPPFEESGFGLISAGDSRSYTHRQEASVFSGGGGDFGGGGASSSWSDSSCSSSDNSSSSSDSCSSSGD